MLQISRVFGLLGTAVAVQYTPHGFACLDGDPTVGLPMCNPSLPVEDRVANLVSLLTTEEKIGLTGSFNGDLCSDIDAGVPRLNIPNVTQLIEITGTVSSSCYVDNGGVSYCPTVFPAPLSLAASFSKSVWRQKGAVTGIEVGSQALARLFRLLRLPPIPLSGACLQQLACLSHLQPAQLRRPAWLWTRSQRHCRSTQRAERCVGPCAPAHGMQGKHRMIAAHHCKRLSPLTSPPPLPQVRTPRRTPSLQAPLQRRSCGASRRARTPRTCSSQPPSSTTLWAHV